VWDIKHGFKVRSITNTSQLLAMILESFWHDLRNLRLKKSYEVASQKHGTMKQLAAIICFGIVGFAQAQSTSRDVEIYERYENGELVEQRQSATENGVPIKDFDFEKLKEEMLQKSENMEKKMEEMSARFEEKRKEFSASIDEKMKSMEQRMADFEKRSEEMHQQMDARMRERGFDSAHPAMDNGGEKSKEKRESTPEVEKLVVGESTQSVKFT
jgi:hypothetical protein